MKEESQDRGNSMQSLSWDSMTSRYC